jgi:hypothetical protein
LSSLSTEPLAKRGSIFTYTAVTTTEKTYLGTTTSGGIRVWKDMPIEYIVGELLAVTLKLSNIIKSFPNLLVGESIAFISPPTFPLA